MNSQNNMLDWPFRHLGLLYERYKQKQTQVPMNCERSANGADCINYTSKLQLFTELSKHSQPAATWRYSLQIVTDIKQDASSVNRCRKLHQYRQIINFLKAKTNGLHPWEIISITQPWRWGDKL